MDVTEPIAVQITDDGGAKILEGAPVVAGGAAADGGSVVHTDDPAAGVEEMKRQVAASSDEVRLANERTAAAHRSTADAERRAREAQNETNRLAALNDDNQYNSIVNALSANQAELESLAALSADAMEKGDYLKAKTYDAQATKVGARIVSLETGKSTIEQQRVANPRQQQQQQPQTSPAEEQEKFLANVAPESAAWIRAHPQFFTDPGFRDRVMASAGYVERFKGLTPSNPEYFRQIEQDVGLSQSQRQQENQGHVQQQPHVETPISTAGVVRSRESPKPAAPPVAAAPSRPSIPDARTQNGPPTTIVLTKEQREIAHIMHPKRLPTDPDPETVYARNLYALQKEGQITY